MHITVKSFANIRDILGQEQLPCELPPGATLGSLLDTLMHRFGTRFKDQIHDRFTDTMVPFLLLVGDTAYRSSADLDTPLSEGDTVTIMIPFDGG